MALHKMLLCALFAVFLAFGSLSSTVQASDPELTSDFFVPEGKVAADLDGAFFTNTTLENVQPNLNSAFATVTPVNQNAFPALTGLGISSALIQFPPGTVNPPHTHPRGTELLYVIEGTLSVGLVDTTQKLFTQTLLPGDLFVFPKGLVHFQINLDQWTSVKAVVGFSSSNPGLISLPSTLFGKSMISSEVLQKSFSVTADVINKLKAAQV
ncbi:protein MpCupin87 [Marchantia polymorpha subsp. ruderalis]|uniref:Germin-like protein n=2 Tax=Marchantia polymorpha TaxID=3197 RepID=A0AAF6BLG9_MARPO|nr:hypothetical protein MARPO_0010s0116 [Marchantia polymorpha]BBN12853.1 hypothetical protein Mp_5g23420 [Marchantia polymorpha subsp. ruderalis]|eukprot:PTQ46724.1 hypothetical protein MARPO_0010s0116 [Marchantia polymorpha]